MKHVLRTIGFSCALVLTGGLLTQCAPSSGLSDRDEMYIERFTNRLKMELSLSEAQTGQVRQILTQSRLQAIEDRKKYADDRIALQQAMIMRGQQEDAEIEKILTDEQKAKFEAMKDKMREEGPGRGQGGGRRGGRRPGGWGGD